jgi:hypothetical protein
MKRYIVTSLQRYSVTSLQRYSDGIRGRQALLDASTLQRFNA